MMRIIYSFIFLWNISLLCNSCTPKIQDNYRIRLDKWEEELSQNQQAILDSLENFGSEQLSPENRAHYNLLYTIAANKSNIILENDLLINQSVQWYSANRNHTRLIQSLLYNGIVLYQNNESDTNAYLYLKKAETLYREFSVENDELASKLYSYLGHIHCHNHQPELGHQYYEKAFICNQNIPDRESRFNTRINIVRTDIYSGNYSRALSQLKQIENDSFNRPEEKTIPICQE